MRSTAVRYLLRPMLPGDIPQVMEIERQSFPTIWPQTAYKRELRNRLARYLVATEPPQDEAPEPAQSPEPPEPPRQGFWPGVRRLLGAEPEPAPTSELIVGSLGLWLMVGQGHIVTIAVRESQRRRGIGEWMLIAALNLAIQEEQETVTLEYRRSNLAARALYAKYGFTEVGVRRRYYSDNHEDAVIMTTPPILTPQYQDLLRDLSEAHRRRWSHLYGTDSQMMRRLPRPAD
ncbi:MAG: GNAT family N-acetyltransferase [Dehalococcoidia bacterium]